MLRLGLCYRKSIRLCKVRVPHSGVETFGNISLPFVPLPPFDLREKFLRRSSQRNPSIGGLNAKSGSGSWYVTIGSLISWWVSCFTFLTQQISYSSVHSTDNGLSVMPCHILLLELYVTSQPWALTFVWAHLHAVAINQASQLAEALSLMEAVD